MRPNVTWQFSLVYQWTILTTLKTGVSVNGDKQADPSHVDSMYNMSWILQEGPTSEKKKKLCTASDKSPNSQISQLNNSQNCGSSKGVLGISCPSSPGCCWL